MPRMIASRNLRICTKDCMCLYVCPTGATDTETGQIDFAKCIGCGDCARSCPNSAISMIPADYPHQQPKDETVVRKVRAISDSKARQEAVARQVAETTDDPGLRLIMKAVRRSERLMGEDLIRETGYLLPQSGEVRRLLEAFVENPPEGFPVEAAKELLQRLNFNA